MARAVAIAELADRQSLIENKEFDNAVIVGPAVVVPLERVTLDHCRWATPDLDALFIELAEGRNVVGVIGLKDVTFRNCDFQNVGIAGTAASLDSIRSQFEQPEPIYSSPSVPSAAVLG